MLKDSRFQNTICVGPIRDQTYENLHHYNQRVVGRLEESGAASRAGAGGSGNSGLSVLPRATVVSAAGSDGGPGARMPVRSALGATASSAAVHATRAHGVESRYYGHPGPPFWVFGDRSFANKMQWVPPFSVSDLIARDRRESPDV